MYHECSTLIRKLSITLACLCFPSLLSVDGTRVLAAETTRPANGLREKTPHAHALVGGRIVVSPGRTIERGTLVVRDGVIEAVGAEVKAPADARVWDIEGKTVYAGLIDAYSEAGAGNLPGGAPYWNSQITPQRAMASTYKSDNSLNEQYRSQGVTARLVAPDSGIVRGKSVLVSTADQSGDRAILLRDVAQHMRLTVHRSGGFSSSYPNSPMGAVALARQTMYDADWYRRAWQAYEASRKLSRPEQNDALAALAPALDGRDLVVIDALDEQYALRADRFAREFGLRIALLGSGREYRRLEAIRDIGRAVIVPVNFPKAPNVATPEAAADASLRGLMHWDIAPENPARLAKAGVSITLTGHGLKSKKEFLSAIRKAVRRGLSEEAALAALTTNAAKLYGAEDRLGTLEAGKLAHFVVTDGDLFAKKTKIVETWVDGRRYEIAPEAKLDLRGKWRVRLSGGPRGRPKEFIVKLTGVPTKLEGTIEPTGRQKTESHKTEEHSTDEQKTGKVETGKKETEKDDEKSDARSKSKKDDSEGAGGVKLSQVSASGLRLAFQFDAKQLKRKGIPPGVAQVSATVSAPPQGAITWIGELLWPDGASTTLSAKRVKKTPEAKEKDDEGNANAVKDDDEDKDNADENENNTDKDEHDDAVAPDKEVSAGAKETKENSDETTETSAEKKGSKDEKPSSPASFAVNYPLGAYGRQRPPEQPELLVLKGATIWTCDEQGILEDATLLVRKGKIAAVGKNIEIPAGAEIVDATGSHITPGIIDCHSHMATDGGINESTQAITAEVRIGDFIDATDITIYRQLAGGVTEANVLHGSANPIGGQNQVIKLRWGALPEEMKMSEAPQGIKFALGENVKQSNRGKRFTTRYPQTRMGVEQIIRDAFQTAREYRQRHAAWKATHEGMPPRRDLELDALSEILAGKRWIHCHSYRQDEILSLLRVLEEYHIQIGSLQHILEGYKVADAMAKHGATGSSFSDWWAYKFEVYDAIPYNGALMHKAGVVVSFNSDDGELGTHLNQEAGKAVKYGGVEPVEALKFVTLNPAKQLRIDHYVGSITPGKQADFAVWNGPPLSTYSRCEQTWIDGRKYFDRADEPRLRKQFDKMRNTLVQKILKTGSAMRRADEDAPEDENLWPREDIFCHGHGHGDGDGG